MGVTNTLTQRNPSKKFSVAIQSDGYQRLINQTLGDPDRSRRFVAAISSAVANNPDLQACDAGSILSSALLGESLNLSPSPQLGQYYLVPFNLKDRGKVAQFQLGYKGYIQLASRSGEYKKLNALAIKEGELINYDPLNEDVEVRPIEDEREREEAETVGYYAMFEYHNGFKKALYWTKQKMDSHAMKYSKGYQAKRGYTFWEKDFDAMAIKTMIRQLISKWGIMSIEMQTAYAGDMGVIGEDEQVQYVDSTDDAPEYTVEDVQVEPPADEPAAEYDPLS